MLKRFLLAVQFLTKIPVIVAGKAEDADIAGSLVYYPAVGLLLAGLVSGVYAGFSFIFPAPLSGLLALIFFVYLTGALHLDGFVDTVDGFYGNRRKEDIFVIMKDSRIGAMGAVWLGLLLILKAWLFISLGQELVPALILAAVLSRAAIVLEMRLAPAAKKNSLASVFCDKLTLMQTAAALLFALIVSLFCGIKGIMLFAWTVLAAVALVKYFKSRIGGLTGDTVGFSAEFLEISVLVLWSVKT
ncbi:MAG: adenosylcobinamide-GDP ribazoletransferase [Candidatus Firestonebacteria bacterium]